MKQITRGLTGAAADAWNRAIVPGLRGRVVGSDQDKLPTTPEEALAELKGVKVEFQRLVMDAMSKGARHDVAFDTVCKEHPELLQRESQLIDWINAAAEGRRDLEKLTKKLAGGQAYAGLAALQLVEDKREADPSLTYGAALKLVATENPLLFRESERLKRFFVDE